MKQEMTISSNQNELEKQFEYVNSLIEQHRSSAITKVNTKALLTASVTSIITKSSTYSFLMQRL